MCAEGREVPYPPSLVECGWECERDANLYGIQD